MKKKIFCFFLLGLVLFSCGKKGPLILEIEKAPPAVENFQVRQIGDQIELAWKFPNLQADKKGPFEMSGVSKVYVYHSVLKPEETPAMDIFLKKAKLLAKLKAAEIKGLGQNSSQYRIAFKNKELQEKIHGFTLIYFYGRKKSVPGPLQTLKTLIPPLPIQDLKISQQGKIVILNWSRPAIKDKGQPENPISGFQIYRKISSADGEPDFRPISSRKVVNEFFHDRDSGTDGDYEYQVSSCLGERVESAPSNTAKIRILDTFPPDIPGNLVIFTAKDQIFLTWEAVADTDLAFYRLYRKSSEKNDFKILADKVTDNFFRDTKVARGKLYIYAVSAVDKKGNESELTRLVQQLFE